VSDDNPQAQDGFQDKKHDCTGWEKVNIPHNWDTYEGYRRLLHGNRHGTAWYRKTFSINNPDPDNRYFLFFEGVGSYATVYLNGDEVGYHAGGRTTFTLDVTNSIHTDGSDNLLAVKADHPAGIEDLPWVCGGCSPEWGFSEGSQPFGIFRPVSLYSTDAVRIQPFGIHIWNDTTVGSGSATLYIDAELRNYGSSARNVTVLHQLLDRDGNVVGSSETWTGIDYGRNHNVHTEDMIIQNPVLWSPDDPYLYTLVSEIRQNDRILDRVETRYGIRWISWPIYREDGDHRFYINGKPFFINGTAEYEHMIGQGHAFTDLQVKTRVMQVKAAGFNAFRDAHQPHNLRYQDYWDELGILFWTQMSAHIWFDTPEFTENFRQLLRDWVKERRNSPSVILWGLQNESTMPEWFAKECTEIIREMDPTSPSQRLVTTCNGGVGTDWNVVQNWSGTYAGDLFAYDRDLGNELLNGEYGAWRSIDLHTEGPFNQNGAYSEDRMCKLMETKIRLGEKAKDNSCGQFQWIFNSHDNPGRTQNGEGLREMDRIGPVNYKGLMTPWGELLDVYYMYRANYVNAHDEPMVYIVSHTWPNRWREPGIKDSIVVYSNCDEVELFNGFSGESFGRKKKGPVGTNFRWDGVDIRYDILRATGYVDGMEKASDMVRLQNLPGSPKTETIYLVDDDLLAPSTGYNYIYRVNCGGPEYKDSYGNIWQPDRARSNENYTGSSSWTNDYDGLPAYYASQRRTFDPILNTSDEDLFKSFRYGRDKLAFHFPVPDGNYLVDLYFIEPWYGTGGSMDCKGWRSFDLAINDSTYIDDLDIWQDSGHDRVLKKTVYAPIQGGELTIHFPEINSGQAVISAIAIASKKRRTKPADPSPAVIQDLKLRRAGKTGKWQAGSWLDIGDPVYTDLEVSYFRLPANFFGSEYIRTTSEGPSNKKFKASFRVQEDADVFILLPSETGIPGWMNGFIEQENRVETSDPESGIMKILAKRYNAGDMVNLGTVTGSMYSIVVCEVSGLGQAADMRARTRYQAEEAIHSEELKVKEFRNNTYLEYTDPDSGSISWKFNVGLGDTYSIEFRYLNNAEEIIPMKMRIMDSKGMQVSEETLLFTPRTDSWRGQKTTTGTSINAGTYTLELTPLGKAGLGIDAIDIR